MMRHLLVVLLFLAVNLQSNFAQTPSSSPALPDSIEWQHTTWGLKYNSADTTVSLITSQKTIELNYYGEDRRGEIVTLINANFPLKNCYIDFVLSSDDIVFADTSRHDNTLRITNSYVLGLVLAPQSMAGQVLQQQVGMSHVNQYDPAFDANYQPLLEQLDNSPEARARRKNIQQQRDQQQFPQQIEQTKSQEEQQRKQQREQQNQMHPNFEIAIECNECYIRYFFMHEVTLSGIISMKNCQFDKAQALNCTFNCRVQFEYPYYSFLQFLFQKRSPPYVAFTNCMFYGVTELTTSDMMGFVLVGVTSSNVLVHTDFATYEQSRNRTDSIEYSLTTFDNCYLKGNTFFRGSLNSTQFYNTRLTDTILLDRSVLEYKKKRMEYDFDDAVYETPITLKLEQGSTIGKLQPKLSTLQGVSLYLFRLSSNDGYGSKQESISISENYDLLLLQAKNYKTTNEALRNEVVDWLEYRRTSEERKYLSDPQNRITSRDTWRFWLLQYLQLTVNNGYKGGERFLLVSVLVILFFGLLYLTFHRRVINRYVITDEILPNQNHTLSLPLKATVGSFFLNLGVCIWFSLAVFVSPRFLAKYFRFHGGLIALITLEWLIGLLLILTFIVNVAAKYPFIKALFGL